MWAPRDRSGWGGKARGQRGGAGKGATGKVSDGTQRPRHCKGLVWASCPQLRTLLLSRGSPEWAWGRGRKGKGHPVWMDLGSTSQRAGQAHKHTVSQPPKPEAGLRLLPGRSCDTRFYTGCFLSLGTCLAYVATHTHIHSVTRVHTAPLEE